MMSLEDKEEQENGSADKGKDNAQVAEKSERHVSVGEVGFIQMPIIVPQLTSISPPRPPKRNQGL